jgi:hypothetical protein
MKDRLITFGLIAYLLMVALAAIVGTIAITIAELEYGPYPFSGNF